MSKPEGGGPAAGEPDRRLSTGTMEHLKAIEALQKATLTESKPVKKKPKDKNKVMHPRNSIPKGFGADAPHVPKTDIDKRHKIILFGRIYKGTNGDVEEEKLYSFTHQRADGVITEGYIPVGFLSMLPVEDEHLEALELLRLEASGFLLAPGVGEYSSTRTPLSTRLVSL
eukprot:g12576.t1